MYLRGDISILVPALFSEIVAILTAPAVFDFEGKLFEIKRSPYFWVYLGYPLVWVSFSITKLTAVAHSAC
jgi:hypothetical protein